MKPMKSIPGFPDLLYQVRQEPLREYLEIYKEPFQFPVITIGSVGRKFDDAEQEAIWYAKNIGGKADSQ